MKPMLRLLFVLCTMTYAATADQSGNVTLKTVDGMELRGMVMATTEDEVTLQSSSGIFTLKRSQLATESKAALTKMETADDADGLRKKVAEQERTIAALRTENQQLRAALAQGVVTSVPAPVTPTTNLAAPVGTTREKTNAAVQSGYWISSTGKRHNSGCRYYQTSKGRPGNSDEGVPCKICGG